MGRIKISIMPPITLKVRRNRTDKSSWKFYRRVDNFIVELVFLSTKMMSSFDSCQVLLLPPPSYIMNHRLRYKNIAYNAGEFTR